MKYNFLQYDLKIEGKPQIKDGIIENISKEDAIAIKDILIKYGYKILQRESPWQNIDVGEFSFRKCKYKSFSKN